jgi:hypothetical protein
MTKTKAIVTAAIVFAAAFAIGNYAAPPKAKCAWCYSGTCYDSSICGSGCVCVKRGLDLSGECASFD